MNNSSRVLYAFRKMQNDYTKPSGHTRLNAEIRFLMGIYKDSPRTLRSLKSLSKGLTHARALLAWNRKRRRR